MLPFDLKLGAPLPRVKASFTRVQLSFATSPSCIWIGSVTRFHRDLSRRRVSAYVVSWPDPFLRAFAALHCSMLL
jgi:hypothetical protein